jgi:hypothetical protein
MSETARERAERDSFSRYADDAPEELELEDRRQRAWINISQELDAARLRRKVAARNEEGNND